jgi:hypothetical protein
LFAYGIRGKARVSSAKAHDFIPALRDPDNAAAQRIPSSPEGMIPSTQ